MGPPHTYGALTVGQFGVEVEVEDPQLPQLGFLLQQEPHQVPAQETAAARHNEHQAGDGGRRLWGTGMWGTGPTGPPEDPIGLHRAPIRPHKIP